MAYISSNANRWYCAQESGFGQLPTISAANRIPAVKLSGQQQRQKSQRKDKTGSRTFTGMPVGMRLQTTFDMTSYMRDWPDPSALPAHGPLVEAAMGASGVLWTGNAAATGSTTTNLVFATPHGLQPGQAVTYGGEIRFVAAVASTVSVILNAPLSVAPVAGAAFGQTATYNLATTLPTVSLFDYWDPSSAVQRVFCGAAVNQMKIQLNGDFHQIEFKGMAQDVIDSASFASGQGGATAFPAEPMTQDFSYSPVPGNLGQVWLGVAPNQFFSVADASIQVDNDLDMRTNEFGTVLPQGVVPGMRSVTASLELFSQDDEATMVLYQAARQQSPISMMFQLGQIPGQMMGIYLKSLVPSVPEFDDSDRRLRWNFKETRAQGIAEDEIVVAFG
jgi:hypothetical protein